MNKASFISDHCKGFTVQFKIKLYNYLEETFLSCVFSLHFKLSLLESELSKKKIEVIKDIHISNIICLGNNSFWCSLFFRMVLYGGLIWQLTRPMLILTSLEILAVTTLIIISTWRFKNLSHRKDYWKPKSNQNNNIGLWTNIYNA